MAIGSLERDLGERLLERGANGIQLTPKGRAFLAAVRSGRQRLFDDITGALGLSEGRDRVIRVGAVVHFGLYRLLPLIERLGARLPRMQVGFTWSFQSMEALKDGKLDFAFVAWTSRPKRVRYAAV